MKRVVIESPFAASSPVERERHVAYAREACRDAISRGEAPFAAHLLYPQFLLDDDTNDRTLGILASAEWLGAAQLIVVYTDLGISPGMERGIRRGKKLGLPVEYRQLVGWEA